MVMILVAPNEQTTLESGSSALEPDSRSNVCRYRRSIQKIFNAPRVSPNQPYPLRIFVFAAINLAIDIVNAEMEFVVLNGFFLFASLAGLSYMRRIMDYRLLSFSVNLLAFLVVTVLLIAKSTISA